MGSNPHLAVQQPVLCFEFISLFLRFPLNRPTGSLPKPRCSIQALTPASGAPARPQPLAPPRPFSCEDVIFLFLSPALPPPSLSLSSFSFLIPLSSPPPLLFLHHCVPLAVKGMAFPFPSASARPVFHRDRSAGSKADGNVVFSRGFWEPTGANAHRGGTAVEQR